MAQNCFPAGETGALAFNIASFIPPAVYMTLTKLWISGIDPAMVATSEAWTYIGVAAEVINEGLPRAAYKVIGDRARLSHPQRVTTAFTMIAVQCVLGAILSIIIAGAAKEFAASFVPANVWLRSVKYVRISAFSSLFSALEVAVSTSTRALDCPDVPLAIATATTALNILLDVLLVSKYRVYKNADVTTQAAIRLACDGAGAMVGLVYFTSLMLWKKSPDMRRWLVRPHFSALRSIIVPGSYTFIESAIRNAFYLWLVHGIVSLGNDYATAWAIFNTIRWGLVMVPVYALEATSATFVGHAWGAFRQRTADGSLVTKANVWLICRPAMVSVAIALVVEVPLCIGMSLAGTYPFALYLSQSPAVATITAHMWRTIDWCYILYAATTQLAAILLATKPQWYLGQSLASNLLWVMPWAIVVQVHGLKSGDPWMWHAIVFGGSMVFSFVVVLIVLVFWGWRVWRTKWDTAPRPIMVQPTYQL
ncbi:uncharacterized protein EHS24_003783 [Apiotrichum porosum]|uniref:Polysaccharide biosynthesis protein C-terminal domain-containing protein n=1 Tax=Apiotrichum porosum TaxID=105984 RepID=A0A427XE18_9TREE|nr:uncharacterized protein EHS24_003783 [Apiotrichum porosum]RSH77149.1 hypothetical protein EHS24_003783 [Apiotrichum porosum]